MALSRDGYLGGVNMLYASDFLASRFTRDIRFWVRTRYPLVHGTLSLYYPHIHNTHSFFGSNCFYVIESKGSKESHTPISLHDSA
jgi:hypothetical protein